MPQEFTRQEVDLLLNNVDNSTPEELEEIYKIVEALEAKQKADAARADLIEFCKLMQADYTVGKHHRILAPSRVVVRIFYLLMTLTQSRTCLMGTLTFLIRRMSGSPTVLVLVSCRMVVWLLSRPDGILMI